MSANFAHAIYTIGRITPSGVDLLGTGFAASTSLIATAAHITNQDENGLVMLMPHINSMKEYQDTTNNQVHYAKVTIAEYDPIHDVALLSFDGFTASFPYRLTSTDAVPPGADIVSVGFPHADWGRRVLTQQNSTVGARILMQAGPIKATHIVMNVQTRPGTSGSPVFTKDLTEVCAMVIGSYAPQGGGGIRLGNIDPTTLHQTTHAVSAEYIRAMVR